MTAPRIRFVIGGVQKGGTTALAQFLARHPQVGLPQGKEAHVFDAPDFDDGWGTAEVDQRYAGHFAHLAAEGKILGDATPIYCFHPLLVERIARYHPGMKWVLILRHPVERAVSQYQMERGRGDERWPFWPAILLEKWRLRGHESDFSLGSPLRHYSYRARGAYAGQLDTLYRHFPREQVLVLRNESLAGNPAAVLAEVCRFLEIPQMEDSGQFGRVFAGNYRALSRSGWRFRLLSWLMRRELRQAEKAYGLTWS